MKKRNPAGVVHLIFKAVALAMGVAVIALSALGDLETDQAIVLLGIGVTCLALTSLIQPR